MILVVNPRLNAALLAVSFVVVGIAGCLGTNLGAPLTIEEAPEGPDSMRVGLAGEKEYVRLINNYSGYRLVFNRETRLLEVAPLKQTLFLERRIRPPEFGYDAFLRLRPIVPYEFVLTDLTPAEGAAAMQAFEFGLDLTTRHVIYESVRFNVSEHVYSCTVPPFCQTTQNNFTIDGKHYPRVDGTANWGSLEGQTLKIGRLLTFDRSFQSGNAEFRFFLNYTPVREETMDGFRSFVVRVDTGLERLTPMAPPREPEEALVPPTSSAEPSEDALPLPSHFLWVTAQHSVPIHESNTVWFKHNGNKYFRMFTSHLESYEAPKAELPWGDGEQVVLLDRMPGAKFSPPPTFVESASSRLTYPLAEAWQALQEDLTLTDFQEYLEKHPKAFPFLGTYSPDPVHRSYTWNLLVGDSESPPWFLRTRRNLAPGPPGQAYLTQNGDLGGYLRNFRAPGEEVLRGREYSNLEAGLAAYEQLRPGAFEPALLYSFATYQGYEWSFEPILHVHSKMLDPEPDPFYPFETRWWSKDPVSINLVDGGLAGDNATFRRGVDDWPWFPSVSITPPILSLGSMVTALDPEVRAPHETLASLLSDSVG